MLGRLTATLVIGWAALLAAGVLLLKAPFAWLAAPPGRRAPIPRWLGAAARHTRPPSVSVRTLTRRKGGTQSPSRTGIP